MFCKQNKSLRLAWCWRNLLKLQIQANTIQWMQQQIKSLCIPQSRVVIESLLDSWQDHLSPYTQGPMAANTLISAKSTSLPNVTLSVKILDQLSAFPRGTSRFHVAMSQNIRAFCMAERWLPKEKLWFSVLKISQKWVLSFNYFFIEREYLLCFILCIQIQPVFPMGILRTGEILFYLQG